MRTPPIYMRKVRSSHVARLKFVVLAALTCASGCCVLWPCREPVPPPIPRSQVLAALQQRADQFLTVQDTAITLSIEVLTDEGMEDLPKLGGVLALDSRLPGMWLHAEKMTKGVFTLRATADRFSLELPETRELVIGGPQAYDNLPHLIRPFEAIEWLGSPEWLGLDEQSPMTVLEADYRFDVLWRDALVRQVFVDRRKVAVSRILDYDLLGSVRTDVTMDRYREAGGIEFPHRLAVHRPQHGCRVQLELGRPKFNRKLQRELFDPKTRRPGWEVIDLDREPLSNVKAFNPEP